MSFINIENLKIGETKSANSVGIQKTSDLASCADFSSALVPS
ncbi:MAG: hypothetical protein O9267_05345 [Flavobacterium sp.]|nr:hypothetical protein [Flavobacterium sp.]MCZ8197009.1 hypothetical protein [Flavobacterium sp.]